MHKGRLEAFSDGVMAIIITIMVLELHVPHGSDFAALSGLFPIFLSYILSFIFVGIYWNNHHHLFQATELINGTVLWANLHLLFWLSLFPFASGWMGENNFATLPVAVYGAVLLMASVAYFILTKALQHAHIKNKTLKRTIGPDRKGQISSMLHTLGIGAAFYRTWLALALHSVVAAIWLIPDKRIEDEITK